MKNDNADMSLSLIMVMCVILLVFCIAGLVGSIIFSVDKSNELKDNDCVEVESIFTGNNVYCGKACWRKEKKVTYQCKDMNRTYFE